jgi:hypothetical protein
MRPEPRVERFEQEEGVVATAGVELLEDRRPV